MACLPLRASALFGLALAAVQAAPQPANQGVKVSGRVLDPRGAPVANAQITAVPAGGSEVYAAASGPAGEFSIQLGRGDYTLKVSADGFLNQAEAVSVSETAPPPRDFVLQIAPVRDTVTISESAGYQVEAISSGTRTLTPLRDIPQSIAVVSREQIRDQVMMSIADVVRYVPGVTAIQGENNRDQLVIRGNSTSADFFLDGVRDDVQYYRDLYNVERVEALKGPNAMIFGRGGGGGVINRVTKEAGFTPLRELVLQTGSYGHKRLMADLDQPLGEKAAFRLNGMYEDSGSFRKGVNLERYGVSPALTLAPSPFTTIKLGYEHFHDGRVADRGIPSFLGRPADVPISTFFGNPDDSYARARVNLGSAVVEHRAGGLTIHNSTLAGDYDRGYQNYVPGAVTPDKMQVALSVYNNATRRLNLFNRTDVIGEVSTGRLRHTLLGGVEAGRQVTDNFRNSGFFENGAASLFAPYDDPTIHTLVTFRQNATDADNHLRTTVAAAYVQDQVELSRFVQLVAGVRLDHFDLRYRNNRNRDELRRIDNLVSPRAGIVFKPVTRLSIYGNYSVSYLPSSGDQFSSLTAVTQQVKPEKFNNYEAGVKWDLRRGLSLTSAVYRLDRTNTRAIDPNDPTRIIQTGSQRTNGYELGLQGSLTKAWIIAGGYAYQDAFISSATAAARAGAQVAQVPHHTFSLWNQYQFNPRLGAGLGVLRRADMFAGIDNTVILPSYTRADAAVYVSLTEKLRLQANVENLFDTRYYINADSNNNISPGSRRSLRVGLIARF